jgi:IclR family KDG regulon transcriptional repressor
VKSKLDLKTVAEASMDQLAKETGESVNLGVLLDETALTLFNVDGESSVLVSKLLPVSPLHCSSMGKILMCSKDEAFIRAYFESKQFQPRTIHTLTTYEAFMAGRDQILKEGIAYDAEEYEYGLTCIAAPVTNCLGEVIAALSVSGPTSRLQYKGMERIIQLLKTAAGEISRRVIQAGL